MAYCDQLRYRDNRSWLISLPNVLRTRFFYMQSIGFWTIVISRSDCWISVDNVPHTIYVWNGSILLLLFYDNNELVYQRLYGASYFFMKKDSQWLQNCHQIKSLENRVPAFLKIAVLNQ